MWQKKLAFWRLQLCRLLVVLVLLFYLPPGSCREQSSDVAASGVESMSAEENANTREREHSRSESAKRNRIVHLLYEEAIKVLRRSRSRTERRIAVRRLQQAASLGSADALAQLGYVALFGEDEVFVEVVEKAEQQSSYPSASRQNVTRALELFEQAAERGVASAQLGLAFMYAVGLAPGGVSQARALAYLTFAALGGDGDAQKALAYRYWTGASVEQSCEAALTYYSLAATRIAERVPLVASPMQLGSMQRVRLVDEYETGSATTSALGDELIDYHVLLADRGDLSAQLALGQLFYFGARGVDQNFVRAAHYFERAVAQGSALAAALLARMHLDGSVMQHNATAYALFRRAADKGHPSGHAGMGLMHLLGFGVAQNFAKAFAHLSVAVEHGWTESTHQLALMYYRGLGVRRDVKRAAKLFGAAAQSGSLQATYNLAQLYAHGAAGLARSCPSAAELFKNVAERDADWLFADALAAYHLDAPVNDAALVRFLFLAELGHELAQCNAAFILERAETALFRPPGDSPTNTTLYQLASTYWYRAAVQGSGVARVKLGDYFYYGRGFAIDYEQAAAHYRVAAEQHRVAQALFNLGMMHHQGVGVKTDQHLAKRYFDQAAEASAEASLPVTLALVRLNSWLFLNYAGQIAYGLLLLPFEIVSSFYQLLGIAYALLLLSLVLLLVCTRRAR